MSESTCQDDQLQNIIATLNDKETLMANKVYQLAERLEASLLSEQANNPVWFENLNRLDSDINVTLSDILREELAAAGKIENIMV